MSNLNQPLHPEYTVDAISNHMSLRKPQKQSIKILDSILQDIPLSKNGNLLQQQFDIQAQYPIFSDFEHTFMSLTFALATGVGKTKLMGAFMTYLFTNKGVRNFFVVAPNLTIYSKLKNDLGNPSPDNEKYVFKGVGCFASQRPNVWVDDDYRSRPQEAITDSTDSINIYIFNISKFNSEERNIMSLNEYLGQSFFDYLKSLDDLVIIMDESHHYRAKGSAAAINDLRPVLGLELTATPQVQQGSKAVLFKNVVYEYPLSAAIRDGYTRTPYALTRRDIHAYNMTPEELDKTMINDGILRHENMKVILKKYAINNHVRLVKPFMLIVCKDTTHAQWVLDYIKSDAFREGRYKDKVILIHSNQTGAEKEENVQKLLEVERTDNPVEIVIHVNILKEGWDVNNLYTIVPLRTATSKTLREQTIGRGLRLPYGKRTGDNDVDSVTITAHDKFDEIIAEAQRGDSIFKANGVIYAEMERRRQLAQSNITLFDTNLIRGQVIGDAGLDHNDEITQEMANDVLSAISRAASDETLSNPLARRKAQRAERLAEIRRRAERDLADRYRENTDLKALIEAAFGIVGNDIVERAEERTMYIPKLSTENSGEEEYSFKDFDLDMSDMNSYVPLEEEILLKNLLDSREAAIVIRGTVIDYDTVKPEKRLVDGIREISEIDYEKCGDLVRKIVKQFLDYYRAKYPEDKVRNICLSYRRDILNHFKSQLIAHLVAFTKGLIEVPVGLMSIVREAIDYTGGEKDLTEPSGEQNIRSIAYSGARKALVSPFKFDSEPERVFAMACENSPEVIQWLRPAATQFNITYNRGHRYEPDFVVETSDTYYLVEVKARNRLSDPEVIAKKERAIAYCRVASDYNVALGHKPFKYLFIPHDEISASSSFNNLMHRFIEE